MSCFTHWSCGSGTGPGGNGNGHTWHTIARAAGTDAPITYNRTAGRGGPVSNNVAIWMHGAGGTVSLTVPAASQASTQFRAGATINQGSISQSMHNVSVSIPSITTPITINAPMELRSFSVAPASGAIPGVSAPWDNPPEARFSAGSWARTTSGNIIWNNSTDIQLNLNIGHRHLTNAAIRVTATRTNAQLSPTVATVTATPVSGNAGDQFRVFRFNNIQGYITGITVDNIPRETFNIEFRSGTAPPSGGAIAPTTQIPTIQKAHNIPVRPVASPPGVPIFPTARYALGNNNWEHVGWNTGSQVVLNHRNFTTSASPNFVPNGTSTWGAGTSATNFEYQSVIWTDAQRTIPAADNANKILFPIWAPAQTAVTFTLGAAPPGSGTITGSAATIQRLTGNQFTYPNATFFTATGATWEQIGWSTVADIHSRVVRPLQTTLPATANGASGTNMTAPAVFNGNIITAASARSHETWGATRTYYPVWRRVITDGNVIVNFVGGPDGFMDTALDALDIAASMPFSVAPGTNQLLHAGTTNQIFLPSINEMTELGANYNLTFEGWFIRTTWAPVEPTATRFDNVATPDAKVALPPTLWPVGIFAQLWEPYIWIEARWG